MGRIIWVSAIVTAFILSSSALLAFASHLPPQEKALGTDYVRLSQCVPEHGFHWAKNPAKFGPPGSEKNPVVIYYKDRLVGVEYVMPASIAQKEPPRAAMRGPELPLGKNLYKGEIAIDHADLDYYPVFPPNRKDGFKAFIVHLWSVEHEEHEGFCK